MTSHSARTMRGVFETVVIYSFLYFWNKFLVRIPWKGHFKSGKISVLPARNRSFVRRGFRRKNIFSFQAQSCPRLFRTLPLTLLLHLSRKIIFPKLKIWCSKMPTPLRKSAPGPPNISGKHVSCTAPATENASLQVLLTCPTPAIVFGNATKPSRFAHFWQGAQSLAPATRNDIWTSKSGPNMWCFF